MVMMKVMGSESFCSFLQMPPLLRPFLACGLQKNEGAEGVGGLEECPQLSLGSWLLGVVSLLLVWATAGNGKDIVKEGVGALGPS